MTTTINLKDRIIHTEIEEIDENIHLSLNQLNESIRAIRSGKEPHEITRHLLISISCLGNMARDVIYKNELKESINNDNSNKT